MFRFFVGVLFGLTTIVVTAQDLPSGVVVVTVQTIDGPAEGTGVLVEDNGPASLEGWRRGRVITAAHVVERIRQDVKVRFSAGGSSTGSVVERLDTLADVAVIRVVFPVGQIVHPVAEVGPVRGEIARFFGKRTGEMRWPYSTEYGGKFYYDGDLAPGDSGGPVWNEQGEVIGVISGGWFWFRADHPQAGRTWPAATAGLGAIRKILEAK